MDTAFRQQYRGFRRYFPNSMETDEVNAIFVTVEAFVKEYTGIGYFDFEEISEYPFVTVNLDVLNDKFSSDQLQYFLKALKVSPRDAFKCLELVLFELLLNHVELRDQGLPPLSEIPLLRVNLIYRPGSKIFSLLSIGDALDQNQGKLITVRGYVSSLHARDRALKLVDIEQKHKMTGILVKYHELLSNQIVYNFGREVVVIGFICCGKPDVKTYVEAISIKIFQDPALIMSANHSPCSRSSMRSITSNPLEIPRAIFRNIYIDDYIGLALTLGLIGGSSFNGSINVLIIDAIGTLNSKLIKICHYYAPKVISIDEVALLFGSMDNEATVRAGGISFAAEGVCVVEDLQKATIKQRTMLCNAMRSRSTREFDAYSKSSLHKKEDFAVIATIIPNNRLYDSSKSMLQNINMDENLFNEFDLHFVLQDRSNLVADKFICEKAISDDYARRNSSVPASPALSMSSISSSCTQASQEAKAEIQQHIHYAKNKVFPKFTSRTSKQITEFFSNNLDEKKNLHSHLKTLIKLTEAFAKLEMREETTEEDAVNAIRVLKSTSDSRISPSMKINIGKNFKVTKAKMVQFLDALKETSKIYQTRTFPYHRLEEIANNQGIAIKNFREFIQKLNDEGYLLKKSSDSYLLVSI